MILDDLGSCYKWCPLSQPTARMPATWATRVAAPLEGFQQLHDGVTVGVNPVNLASFIKQNRFTMINWSIYLICQENIGFGNKTKYPETRWNADAEDLHQASKTTTRPSPTWIQAIRRYVFGTFLNQLQDNGLCQPWVRNTCPVWSVGYLLWPCFIFE